MAELVEVQETGWAVIAMKEEDDDDCIVAIFKTKREADAYLVLVGGDNPCCGWQVVAADVIVQWNGDSTQQDVAPSEGK